MRSLTPSNRLRVRYSELVEEHELFAIGFTYHLKWLV